MKKNIARVLVTVMLVTSLMGCSSKKEDTSSKESNTTAEGTGLSGKITIATNRTDIVDTTLKEYAQAFMDENPGTEIEYEAIKDYENVLATRVAGSEAPDIYQVLPTMNQDTYGDYFLPIDDLGLSEEALYFYSNSKGTDGKLYALTDSVAYDGIVYNKAAFKKAGIDKVPTTMDEFWETCEKLKGAGIVPMGTAFKDIWPIFPWVAFDTCQVVFNGNREGKNIYLGQDEIFDDTMLYSMNTLREMYKKGYLEADIMSANWDQLKLDLAQGNIAMHYTETWYPNQLVEAGAAQEDIGMFPFPGSKNIVSVAGKAWGISKDTENAELAKAYLEYMVTTPYDDTVIPSNKKLTVEDPFVSELLSYGVEPLDTDIIDPAFVAIRNQIELDEQAFLLTYVMEPDDGKAQTAVDEWNQKWAEARKEIVK